MTVKRKLLSAAAGAAMIPVFLVALPAGTASAPGDPPAPPSRQAQCAAKTMPGGAIQYEPQSVEGPKGLRSCSGGNSRFPELDDNNKGWKVTSVGRTTPVAWKLTARHRSSPWE